MGVADQKLALSFIAILIFIGVFGIWNGFRKLQKRQISKSDFRREKIHEVLKQGKSGIWTQINIDLSQGTTFAIVMDLVCGSFCFGIGIYWFLWLSLFKT